MSHITIGPFSLRPPPDWTLSTVILAGPVTGQPFSDGMLTTKAVRPFRPNLIATTEVVAANETTETYVARQIEGLRKAGVGSFAASEPEHVKLESGLDGLITERVVLGSDGERVRQMQLVCIKDGIAHTLITSHLDGGPFEAARGEFLKMLLSFS